MVARGRLIGELPFVMVVMDGARLACSDMQAYLGDKAEVSLHLGTRVTGYAPISEDAISKLVLAMQATVLCSV